MRVDIVTGLGFGDEGKGATVYDICYHSQGKCLVVRHGGGNQVGHTVSPYDECGVSQFVHHNTGSGTLCGVPTLFSEFCTIDPIMGLAEIEELIVLEHTPTIYIDPKAMLVTPMDVLANRFISGKTGHGTVGVGFGTTVERNENFYKLRVADTIDFDICHEKYKAAGKYWLNKLGPEFKKYVANSEVELGFESYHEYLHAYGDYIKPSNLSSLIDEEFDHIIFEGHQGVLLDQDCGIFPYVTRSKTTAVNAMSMIVESQVPADVIHHNLVTRAYHTRHGNGPFPGESNDIINPHETNTLNEFQGMFRTAQFQSGLFEAGLLYYSMDIMSHREQYTHNINFYVTCCDVIDESERARVLDILNADPPDNIFTKSGHNQKFIKIA